MTNTDRLAQALRTRITECRARGVLCQECDRDEPILAEHDTLASRAPAAVEGSPANRACDAYDEAAESDVPVDPPRCDLRYMIPALAAAFPALTAQVAALTAQCEADKRDAELWRALLSCKRIRILGTAGFGDGNINGLGHYRHFGAEFWTRYGEDVKDAFDGAQVITEFATEAAAIAAGNGEGV